MCLVSYRVVLIFRLFFLRLCCDRGQLGFVPGNLKKATFELSSLVGRLENKKAAGYSFSPSVNHLRHINGFQIFQRMPRGKAKVLRSHGTHILRLASCLKGHDDTVGILVTELLDLTEFLGIKKKKKKKKRSVRLNLRNFYESNFSQRIIPVLTTKCGISSSFSS